MVIPPSETNNHPPAPNKTKQNKEISKQKNQTPTLPHLLGMRKVYSIRDYLHPPSLSICPVANFSLQDKDPDTQNLCIPILSSSKDFRTPLQSSCVCAHVYSHTQLCPALCDPMDYSPPGSSVHGIMQARILEWVAISSSRGSS